MLPRTSQFAVNVTKMQNKVIPEAFGTGTESTLPWDLVQESLIRESLKQEVLSVCTGFGVITLEGFWWVFVLPSCLCALMF